MSKLKLNVERDPLYKWAIESLSPEEQEVLAKETDKLIENLNGTLAKLVNFVKTDDGANEFVERMAKSIKEGRFNNNDGVSPLLWPEKP